MIDVEEAKALYAKGDTMGAADMMERIVGRQMEAGESADTLLQPLEELTFLAAILRSQGQLDRSRELMQCVLDARVKLLGEDDPLTVGSMRNLAGTLFAQDDFAAVAALERRVLGARRRTLGDDHPDSLQSLGVLGTILADQGDLKQARDLLEQSLTAHIRVFGVDTPETDGALRSLARVVYEQRDATRLNALLTIEGEPLHWRSLQNAGDIEGARAELEHALAQHRRVLGEDHPATLELAQDLASLSARRRLWRHRT
ncbi:MAG TPA: tetratricopeptide repeat protein [Solirubrobacteraceae bacterium]|nr:tetratricopeptide repeat protein [Solirubrobacteraceae bacterium]